MTLFSFQQERETRNQLLVSLQGRHITNKKHAIKHYLFTIINETLKVICIYYSRLLSIMSCSKKIAPLVRLDGKTAIVTGANTGIGKVTARDFFQRGHTTDFLISQSKANNFFFLIGAKVILACRNVQRASDAVQDIKKECEGQNNTGQLVVSELDLSSLNSVRKWAKHILDTEESIHLLVNNAGVMMCPKTITEDGNELQFQTNHLSHFLLTLLLLPKIIQSAPARIVNVSSVAHNRMYYFKVHQREFFVCCVAGGTIVFDDLNFQKRAYSAIGAYSQSKLANVLFTKELARRIEGKTCSFFCRNISNTPVSQRRE